MEERMIYPTRDDFNRFFNPRAYLEENFRGVDDEDIFTIKFIAASLAQVENNLLVH
jgi:hypothetical protein